MTIIVHHEWNKKSISERMHSLYIKPVKTFWSTMQCDTSLNKKRNNAQKLEQKTGYMYNGFSYNISALVLKEPKNSVFSLL